MKDPVEATRKEDIGNWKESNNVSLENWEVTLRTVTKAEIKP
jgi:hypothetical protein